MQILKKMNKLLLQRNMQIMISKIELMHELILINRYKLI